MKRDFSDSPYFKKLSSETEEINKLKWIESEKKKQDIGVDAAILLWVRRHKKKWEQKYDNK